MRLTRDKLTLAQVNRSIAKRRNDFALRAATRRTWQILRKTDPVPVDAEGPVEVHYQVCHHHLIMAIAAAKSFYRFSPERFPLVIHEDGSLTDADTALIRDQFPGAHIHSRADADRDVGEELERRGAKRCLSLRKSLVFAIRLFNVIVLAPGKRVLQLDPDVIFLRRPEELISAMVCGEEAWRERYLLDVRPAYTWSLDQVLQHTGIHMEPQFNAGLVLMRRDADSVDLYERCLEMPVDDLYYLEQTLSAIDSSRRGASPLPPEYDAWSRLMRNGGGERVSHHCLPLDFHRHFTEEVGPALLG